MSEIVANTSTSESSQSTVPQPLESLPQILRAQYDIPGIDTPKFTKVEETAITETPKVFISNSGRQIPQTVSNGITYEAQALLVKINNVFSGIDWSKTLGRIAGDTDAQKFRTQNRQDILPRRIA